MGSSPLAETPPKVRARLVFQGEVVGVLTTLTEIGVATSKTAPCTKTQQLYTVKDDFLSGSSNNQAATDPYLDLMQ